MYLSLFSLLDLDNFLATLDKRYTKKVSKAGGTVAKKVRVIGAPSKSSIPIGAPQWTINPSFQGKPVTIKLSCTLASPAGIV